MLRMLLTTMLIMLVPASCSAAQTGLRTSAPTGFVKEQRIAIRTIDERELIYFVDRPLVGRKIPVLLLVDGSSCIGQLRPGYRNRYAPDANSPVPYARIMVEKPGVPHEAPHPSPCTPDFFKHYSIENRVLDHLRVLQHLRKTAGWWNGELLLWGWSDGGDIATQLTAYYPNVTRAVLGAMGGGYTMAEHYEDFWACPAATLGDKREACLADLRADFERMEDNPTWKETWSGKDNAWRVWATRLRSRTSIVLRDNSVPILIVHGEKDHDNTPVASARKLVQDLKDSGNTAFTYWEVPNMGHGWDNLPRPQQKALNEAMLNWLLGVEIGPGGPPTYGAMQPPPD